LSTTRPEASARELSSATQYVDPDRSGEAEKQERAERPPNPWRQQDEEAGEHFQPGKGVPKQCGHASWDDLVADDLTSERRRVPKLENASGEED
jgi:hypothetical protein